MNHLPPATIMKGAAALVLFVSSCLFAAAQKADSQRIAELFNETKTHAAHAEDDAQTLETFARSPSISWQSHADRLRLVKEHVSDLFNDYNEMARIKEKGSPWQQEAIDQLRPVLKGMADHLNATIQHQREHPTEVKFKPWREYVRANSEYVTKASSLIHDLVDYGAARSTADSLEHQLQLPLRAETK